MARIGSDLTPRMIINQWVSFQDEWGILSSISQFKDLENIPDFRRVKNIPLLGYVYVDHDAGISLKVEGLYFTPGEQPPDCDTVSRFLRDSVSLKFRYDLIRMLDLSILENDERIRLSLPVSPEWIQLYENPKLNTARDCTAIDYLRAEGFFDDVYAVIMHSGTSEGHTGTSDTPKPEIVWVRLLEYSKEDRQFRGILLNQPLHEIGIQKNDIVFLNPVRLEDGLLLVVENTKR